MMSVKDFKSKRMRQRRLQKKTKVVIMQKETIIQVNAYGWIK